MVLEQFFVRQLPLLQQDPSEHLPNAPYIMRFPSLAGVTSTLPSLSELHVPFPLTLSDDFFLHPQVFSSNARDDQYCTERLREVLCRFPEFSLSAALSSPAFISSSLLVLPRLSAPSPQVRVFNRFFFSVLPCGKSLTDLNEIFLRLTHLFPVPQG